MTAAVDRSMSNALRTFCFGSPSEFSVSPGSTSIFTSKSGSPSMAPLHRQVPPAYVVRASGEPLGNPASAPYPAP